MVEQAMFDYYVWVEQVANKLPGVDVPPARGWPASVIGVSSCRSQSPVRACRKSLRPIPSSTFGALTRA
eukprot:10376799-Lingulodinium_polyedra.AAC.1